LREISNGKAQSEPKATKLNRYTQSLIAKVCLKADTDSKVSSYQNLKIAQAELLARKLEAISALQGFSSCKEQIVPRLARTIDHSNAP
jgi:hypothetical protein